MDCPGLQESRKLPILDITVWVDWGDKGWRLRHGFYKKECASELTIMARTALSANCKRNTLFQECLRRLGALDTHTTQEDRKQVLEKFLNTLRLSGYGVPVRRDILRGALLRNEEMERLFGNGRPRYRDREAIREQKALKRDCHVDTWFLRGDHTTTLNVQATKDGALAQRLRDKLRSVRVPDGGKTLVQERAGRSITAGLKVADPYAAPGCPYSQKCPVEEEGRCGASRITYQLTCTRCQSAYVGTSGCTLHKRASEHLEGFRGTGMRNAMARHYMVEHPEVDRATDPTPFTAKVVGRGAIKSNLERYITEAVLIKDANENEDLKLLNSRGEWGRARLTRLAPLEA